jgi:ribose-phosphate pyrophosphokinase
MHSYGAMSDLLVFALSASRALGECVAAAMGVPISHHEERAFADGEHKTRPLISVRGGDVYVIQSLYDGPAESVNDKLIRLLFFLGTLRDAGAERVTAVVPYLCYSRKDRRTKARDPVSTRYVAELFEAVGVDAIVTLDAHNLSAYQNAFRCRSEHLEARPLFVHHVVARLDVQEPIVVSPDVGGVKRARSLRDTLEKALHRPVPLGFMEKHRSGGLVSAEGFAGEVAGRTAIIIDDIIASGTTLAHAARTCREFGASAVWGVSTHGIFSGDAGAALADEAIDAIIVTDTIPPFRLDPVLTEQKLTVVSVAPLLAEAVHRLHSGGSLIELIDPQTLPGETSS